MAKRKQPDTKTNAMRELEEAGISYVPFVYDTGGTVPSGVEAAALLGMPVERVYKTLVTKGRSAAFYVFVIPGARELDLKKAALAVGEKSVEMIPQKELVGRTGYVHGGCSPLAMKKRYVTVIDAAAEDLDAFAVSGGKVGVSVQVSPKALAEHLDAAFHSVTRTEG